jgi:hypothetical protein
MEPFFVSYLTTLYPRMGIFIYFSLVYTNCAFTIHEKPKVVRYAGFFLVFFSIISVCSHGQHINEVYAYVFYPWMHHYLSK